MSNGLTLSQPTGTGSSGSQGWQPVCSAASPSVVGFGGGIAGGGGGAGGAGGRCTSKVCFVNASSNARRAFTSGVNGGAAAA